MISSESLPLSLLNFEGIENIDHPAAIAAVVYARLAAERVSAHRSPLGARPAETRGTDVDREIL